MPVVITRRLWSSTVTGKDLPDSYKRYLMNYFRKSLDVMGTPIRIQFKEGENPFANKRNTLTPNQMRKRKRLIKHIKKSNKRNPPLAGFFISTTRDIGESRSSPVRCV